MRGRKALIILISISIHHCATTLIGFDCGNHITNITTISLIDIGECDIKEPPVTINTVNGHLLKLNDFDTTHTYKCSIKVTRVVTHCGMHSHASRVSNGEVSVFKTVSKEDCFNLQSTGFTTIYIISLTEIQRNATTNRPVVYAGTSTPSSACTGGSYNDQDGHYSGVYVAG